MQSATTITNDNPLSPTVNRYFQRGEAGHFNPGNINPRTVLSVWYYSYRHLDIFQPCFNGKAWRIAFQTWSHERVLCVILLLVLAVLLAKNVKWSDASEPVDRGVLLRLSTVLFVMMLGVSSVHALAGGYSASSRHQYIPLALLILLCGSVMALLQFQCRVSKRAFSSLIVFAVCVGICCTWLITGINNYELRRHHELIAYLRTHVGNVPINIEWQPDVYSYFPLMARSTSHNLYDINALNYALEHFGAPLVSQGKGHMARKIVVTSDGDAIVIQERK